MKSGSKNANKRSEPQVSPILVPGKLLVITTKVKTLIFTGITRLSRPQ